MKAEPYRDSVKIGGISQTAQIHQYICEHPLTSASKIQYATGIERRQVERVLVNLERTGRVAMLGHRALMTLKYKRGLRFQRTGNPAYVSQSIDSSYKGKSIPQDWIS